MSNATGTQDKRNCFVLMPISDMDRYDSGHFSRVYEHIIKPACEAEGLRPIRADDVKKANYIIIDILRRLLDCPIAVCDLSARNANVLYELGIRQAFNLPTVLIKDKSTDRVFDIQGIRTLDYDESLRVDTVKKDVENLRKTLKATEASTNEDVNSLIQLLGIQKAELGHTPEISSDTTLILKSLTDISQRLTRLEDRDKPNTKRPDSSREFQLPDGKSVSIGTMLYNNSYDEVGIFLGYDSDHSIMLDNKGEIYKVPPDQDLYDEMSTFPF